MSERNAVERLTDEVRRDAEAVYNFLSGGPSASRADNILAAGSHDLRAAEHAAKLYLEGAAPLIICSGGFGKMTAGTFPRPEGELFAERCMELGVSAEAILVENRSTNTGENFRFSRELLNGKGIFPASGIITCKPYMARRVWATGTRQWGEVTWYVSVPDLSFAEYPTEQAPLESTLQLMVGDLQRCRVYAEKGFQAPVEVPEDIWQANLRLADAGYDEQIIREG